MSLENPKERETSRRARKKGISRLYPLTADKKGNGYSLPPPFTVTGLREVSAKRSSLSPITKMEEIPPVTRRTSRARKDSKKLVVFVRTRFQYIEPTLALDKEGRDKFSIDLPRFYNFFYYKSTILASKSKSL